MCTQRPLRSPDRPPVPGSMGAQASMRGGTGTQEVVGGWCMLQGSPHYSQEGQEGLWHRDSQAVLGVPV